MNEAISIGLTNSVLEVMERDIVRPMSQIPELFDRVKVLRSATEKADIEINLPPWDEDAMYTERLGVGLDQATIERIKELFASFPSFAQKLKDNTVGQFLHIPNNKGEDADLTVRARRLMTAVVPKLSCPCFRKKYRPVMRCGEISLFGLLKAIVSASYPTLKDNQAMVTVHLAGGYEGTLCHIIACRANELFKQPLHELEDQLRASEAQLAKLEEEEKQPTSDGKIKGEDQRKTELLSQLFADLMSGVMKTSPILTRQYEKPDVFLEQHLRAEFAWARKVKLQGTDEYQNIIKIAEKHLVNIIVEYGTTRHFFEVAFRNHLNRFPTQIRTVRFAIVSDLYIVEWPCLCFADEGGEEFWKAQPTQMRSGSLVHHH